MEEEKNETLEAKTTKDAREIQVDHLKILLLYTAASFFLIRYLYAPSTSVFLTGLNDQPIQLFGDFQR